MLRLTFQRKFGWLASILLGIWGCCTCWGVGARGWWGNQPEPDLSTSLSDSDFLPTTMVMLITEVHCNQGSLNHSLVPCQGLNWIIQTLNIGHHSHGNNQILSIWMNLNNLNIESRTTFKLMKFLIILVKSPGFLLAYQCPEVQK